MTEAFYCGSVQRSCAVVYSQWYVEVETMEAHLKELLRRDGIKLWQPPYTVAGRQCGSYPMDMLVKYGRETGRSQTEVQESLEKIRKAAVARLEANKKFSNTGTATLYASKVVVSPSTDTEADASSSVDVVTDESKDQASVECQLSILGHELRSLFAATFSVSKDDFRMVAQAHVIEDNRTLTSQGVEHGMDILCIMLTEEERETLCEQSWRTSADRTRDAVMRLMKNRGGVDIDYLQIADQHGNPVRLPDEERVALALAMALHEKGRKSLKRRQYGQALLYFLEADREFELCRSDILQLVDNYAILCLDIVWCYLRLQRVNSLPDAERRLRLADVGFRRSYGPNFERLAKIRQGILHERALIIRLKVLQGALAYYQRRYRHAHEYFLSVSKEIKALEVDDAIMSQVVAMGYSPAEARLGLRASGGSIEGAVYHIIEERENEARRAKERERQYREKLLQSRFGNTPSGKPLDVETYDKIVEMGFSKRAAGEALQQADNDMNVALEVLRVRPQTQSPGDELIDAVEEALFDQHGAYTEEELIAQISSFGFPAETVTEALRLHPNDLVGAIESLVLSGASGPFRALFEANPDFRSAVMRVAHELQEHQQQQQHGRRRKHSKGRGRSTSGSQTPQGSQAMDDQEAYKQLEEDVSNSLHDHLDTTFEEELQVLDTLQPLVVPHLK